MTHFIIYFTRLALILLFAVYAFGCFSALAGGITHDRQRYIYYRQIIITFLIHGFLSYALYSLHPDDVRYIILPLFTVLYIIILLTIYHYVYPGSSLALINNMCLLLCVGLFILSRLNIEQAMRQFVLAVVSLIISVIIPFVIQKRNYFRKFSYLYAIVGILSLLTVLAVGQTSYGAKLSIGFGTISVQPSEFIKILFVFFVAGAYTVATDLKSIVITTALAAVHILVLVASRDLGSAFIFGIAYLVMMYAATKKLYLLLLGLLAGGVCAYAAYRLFSHVKIRVLAWSDPLSAIDDAGYQVSQSLFAIGTGGWLGSGIGQGMPETIPVVTKDFIFAAICEELGGIVGLCIIFIVISCFLMIFNISMELRDPFYKLVALGLGAVYAIQVFVNVGGVIKFIPSTGVTFPFLSYGGSSLLSTFIIFAIVEGLYVLKDDEHEKRRRKKTNKAR